MSKRLAAFLQTPRWSKPDSNPRSHSLRQPQNLDEAPAGGRACYQREVLSLPRLVGNAGIYDRVPGRPRSR